MKTKFLPILFFLAVIFAGCAGPAVRHDTRVDRRYDRHDTRQDRRSDRYERVENRYSY